MISEDDDRAGGQVLARVVADAFDNRDRAGVADGEPLAGGAVQKSSPRRAVEDVFPTRTARPVARGRRMTIPPPEIALPT